MPATIDALLRRNDLGLTLLAGESAPQLATPIRWVTTSELLDPTVYLRGGELLLTTGMRLKSTRTDVSGYVSRLHSAGVVGIGIGIGHDLAFRRTPTRLVAAAAAHRLPLLLVDEPTPFIAIGEAVAHLHLADETAELARALRGQQAITRAAVTGGPTAVIHRLASLVDGWVVVTNTDGQVIDETPSGVSGEQHEWRRELGRLRDGRAGSATVAAPGLHIAIQAIPRGFLVVGRPEPPSTAHHSMTNVAAALLTVWSGGPAPDAAAKDPAAKDPAATDAAEKDPAAKDPAHTESAPDLAAALSTFQRRSRVPLAESLRVWLAHHGRIGPAARALGIHRNTLAHRIVRAGELLGQDLDDPDIRARLWAALATRRAA